MMSSRRPPTRMRLTPLSQPGMTWPAPGGNPNGWPGSQEASNCSPVDQLTPTYWTVTNSPGLATLPLPLTTSRITSLCGGLPFGTFTAGFWERSFSGPPAGAAVEVAVAVAVGILVDCPPEEAFDEDPQPAMASIASAGRASR